MATLPKRTGSLAPKVMHATTVASKKFYLSKPALQIMGLGRGEGGVPYTRIISLTGEDIDYKSQQHRDIGHTFHSAKQPRYNGAKLRNTCRQTSRQTTCERREVGKLGLRHHSLVKEMELITHVS